MRVKIIFIILCFCIASNKSNAQGYNNPVIPGFHPDPSICKVGEDFYLVNSSFAYFPGVPIFHSKDLINWEKIGHALTRESQVNLKNAGISEGIYAPTISYHEGTFYMVTTNVSDKGNFLVYTDDPTGEWSEPVWLEAEGIDPSLYFEGDKCYLTTNPDNVVHISEINPQTGEQLSESKAIWSGTGGRYPEAPHIYKKDGWYYLLLSEGGTEYGHTVTIARSKNIDGPYDPNPANPILTHIGVETQASPIQGTGHADMVQAEDGSWWMVFLAFRPHSGNHHVIGRETFLAPVRWDENAWPVVNGNGTVNLYMETPTLPLQPFEEPNYNTGFNESKLGLEWIYLRNPVEENYNLNSKEGHIILKTSPVSLNDNESPTFLGRRQKHMEFSATTRMELLEAQNEDEAGLTLFMDNTSHYDLFLRQKSENERVLVVRYRLGNLTHETEEIEVGREANYLRLVGDKDYYSFAYSIDGDNFTTIEKMDVKYLSSETAGGFTGVVIGMFATSKNEDSKGFGKFYEFNYSPKE